MNISFRKVKYLSKVAAIVVVGVFSVAGCGSKSSSNAAATSNTADGKPAVVTTAKPKTLTCPTAALVNAALGLGVSDPVPNSTVPDVVVCDYALGANPSKAKVRLESGSTLDELSRGKDSSDAAGIPTTAITGLGDGAYSSVLSTGHGIPDVNTVVAEKSSMQVLVTSTASIAQAKTLAAQVLG